METRSQPAAAGTQAKPRIEPIEPIALKDCSIATTLSLIGEKWTLLVLRDAFTGVTRFDDFLKRLQCSPAILSARLRTLVAAGLMRRADYQLPGDRVRHEYRLRRAGVELLPVVVGLMQWGDRHRADGSDSTDGGPMILRNRATGGKVRVALVDEFDTLVEPSDMVPERNPAFVAKKPRKR